MIRALLVAMTLVAAAACSSPPAEADHFDELWRLLPAGYDADSCQPPERPTPPVGPPQQLRAQLAALQCGPNSLPGGPAFGYYRLYGDDGTLHDVFEDERTASRQTYWWFEPCPGWQGSTSPPPQPWSHDDAPNERAGVMVCGKVNGPAHGDPNAKAIMWTTESDRVLAVAEGPDLAGLYDWWKSNR